MSVNESADLLKDFEVAFIVLFMFRSDHKHDFEITVLNAFFFIMIWMKLQLKANNCETISRCIEFNFDFGFDRLTYEKKIMHNLRNLEPVKIKKKI